MNEVDVEVFIKFGKETHMKSLYEKGEVYMNTIDFYKNHENKEIGDEYENIQSIYQIQKLSLIDTIDSKDEIELPLINGHVVQHSEVNGNLYCLFSIKKCDFKQIYGKNIFELNLFEFKEFGDSLCIIYKPKTFIDLIEKKLNDDGRICNNKLVEYYNQDTYNGLLDLFCKRKKYSPQKEARILVNSEMNKPIKFEIGSLEKIARFKTGLDDKIRIESTETHLIFSRNE